MSDFFTRAAAYGVIIRDEQILLAHWNEGGLSGWTLPGGGMEWGESAAECALREIKEETGYAARLVSLLGIDSLFLPEDHVTRRPPVAWHSLRVVFEAEVVGGELAIEVGGSTDQAAWVPLERVPALNCVSLVEVALRLWRERPPLGLLDESGLALP